MARFKTMAFVLLLVSALLSAGSVSATDRKASGSAVAGDSLLPVSSRYLEKEELAPDLAEAEADYERTRDDRKAVRRLLKAMRVRRMELNGRRGYRLYSNLAKFSARLKIYPLAMKFYQRAALCQGNSFFHVEPAESDSASALVDSATFAWFQPIDSLASGTVTVSPDSPPVPVSNLQQSFEDGKTAVSYALLLHIKQPLPGKRKSHTHINNVGHMFITLIKYNADSSFAMRSFGFYPRKKGLLSATPLHPSSPSTFKDDALHDWDECVGRTISAERFERILDLLKQCDHVAYHLNRNNCTDFGLRVASLAGISLSDTQGSWPLGRGNNPANAGQSMLEGKYRNADTGERDSLFSCNNVMR